MMEHNVLVEPQRWQVFCAQAHLAFWLPMCVWRWLRVRTTSSWWRPLNYPTNGPLLSLPTPSPLPAVFPSGRRIVGFVPSSRPWRAQEIGTNIYHRRAHRWAARVFVSRRRDRGERQDGRRRVTIVLSPTLAPSRSIQATTGARAQDRPLGDFNHYSIPSRGNPLRDHAVNQQTDRDA
ncbi:hypothetical protein PsYK624_003170 [Phanerochaete sordida]|uniref:Uncharacterized protein n=1 Tax=Phanerochaete sordida TaxID=48140 RepID=A0A9P3FX79_9APHY|nr:hypothetical protein PsYK624_003170 [Phanerochaete sordida]